MGRGNKALDLATAKIGLIGAGKIVESRMIHGFVACAKVDAACIHVTAPSTKNLGRLKQQYSSIHVTKKSIGIFGRYDCDIVFICVHGGVIANCYKGGEKRHALYTNYIPNMRHPFYVLSLVSGFNVLAIRDVLLNPDHPEKYMIELHHIINQCFDKIYD